MVRQSAAAARLIRLDTMVVEADTPSAEHHR
jgi:hypothetical protein